MADMGNSIFPNFPLPIERGSQLGLQSQESDHSLSVSYRLRDSTLHPEGVMQLAFELQEVYSNLLAVRAVVVIPGMNDALSSTMDARSMILAVPHFRWPWTGFFSRESPIWAALTNLSTLSTSHLAMDDPMASLCASIEELLSVSAHLFGVVDADAVRSVLAMDDMKYSGAFSTYVTSCNPLELGWPIDFYSRFSYLLNAWMMDVRATQNACSSCCHCRSNPLEEVAS